MQIGDSGQHASLPLSHDVEPVALDTSDDGIHHTAGRQARAARSQLQDWLDRYNTRCLNRGVYVHGQTPHHVLQTRQRVELPPQPVASTR